MSLLRTLAVKLGLRRHVPVLGYIGNRMMADPSGTFDYPSSPTFVPEGDTTVYAFIYAKKAEAEAVYNRSGKLLRYVCSDPRLRQAGVDPTELRAQTLGHRRNSAHGIESPNQPRLSLGMSSPDGNLVATVRRSFSSS